MLAILVVLVGAAPASASTIHPYLGKFGSFTTPQGIAVDAAGDIYVVDVATEQISKYGPNQQAAIFSGLGTNVIDGAGGGNCPATPSDCDQTPQNGFAFDTGPDANQIAVDTSGGPTNGDIYVTDSFHDVVDVFAATGAYLGQLNQANGSGYSEPCGVAVGPAGVVYVGDYGGAVDEYVPAGNPVTNGDWKSAISTANPCEVAVDPSGDVFANHWQGTVTKYSALGAAEYTVGSNNALALAADPVTGHIYLADGGPVSEYDTSSSTGAALVSTLGGGHLTGPFGIAVAPSGDVYVSDSGGAVHVFGPEAVGPDATTGPASNQTPSGATLTGTINPNGVATTWQFEYGTTSAYGSTAPATPGDAGSGTANQSVSTAITGLTPHTVYHYRLDAIAGGTTVPGADGTFITPSGPPAINGVGITNLGSTSATLTASINPQSGGTSYHFEYGASTSYGTSRPTPDASLGADDSNHAVSLPVTGLSPATTYHVRVVATSSAGTTRSQDHTFTTFASPQAFSLPDGRGWEQVSAPDKNGADLGNALSGLYAMPGLKDPNVHVPTVPVRVSPDGGRVAFVTNLGAFADAQTSGLFGQYLATRGASSWSDHGVDPPFVGIPGHILSAPRYMAWNDSLTEGVFWQVPDQPTLTPDAPKGQSSYYIFDAATGKFQFAATDDLVNFGHEPEFQGASADLSHLLFREPDGSGPLYEAVADSAGQYQRRVASILPDNTTQIAGNAGAETSGTDENAISRDGSRIVFTDNSDDGAHCQTGATFLTVVSFSSCTSTPHQIYLRMNGATRLVSGYAPGMAADPAAGSGQEFVGADQDLNVIYFTSQTKLTQDSTASNDSGDGLTTGSYGDLYRYGVAQGSLTDITADPGDANGAQVIGVLGNSADGRRVYFVARGTHLAGTHGVAGQANLYVWDAGGGQPTTSYIATLQAPSGQDNSQIGDIANWLGNSYARSSEVTPDGGHLLFTSKNQLTGFDNGGYNEVYVYDAGTGSLVCASCAGVEPATGDSFVPFSQLRIGISTTNAHVNAISSDGHYVFFSSAQALVPNDTNGQFDAYEYDTWTGRISLLSSGQSPDPSFFEAADPSGADALFVTRERLVPQDVDNNLDLYDARIGGGFPQPPSSPGCSGASCQGQPSAAPPVPQPGSFSYSGPGNAGSFSVASVSAGARRALARTGRLVLVVTISQAGEVSVTGTARLPGRRSASIVTRASQTAPGAGTLHLTLWLSAAARAALARGHRLTLRLVVSCSNVLGTSTTALGLSPPGRHTPGGRSARRPAHSNRKVR